MAEEEKVVEVEETPPVAETAEADPLAEFTSKIDELSSNYTKEKERADTAEAKYQDLLKRVNAIIPSFTYDEGTGGMKSEETKKEYFVDPWKNIF